MTHAKTRPVLSYKQRELDFNARLEKPTFIFETTNLIETSALVAHAWIYAGVPGDRHCRRAYEERPLREHACSANHHKVLTKTNPKKVERLMQIPQETFDGRWQTYAHLSKQDSTEFEQAGQLSRYP